MPLRADEYPIHLLDLLESNGEVFSTEDFSAKGGAEDFLNSQAVPETLEEKMKEAVLKGKVRGSTEGGGKAGGAKSALMNPEKLASFMLEKGAPQINVVYIPEPDEAWQATSRFITRLLMLKKRQGARRKVLVVLDEAQEFIPSESRPTKEDFTEQSNKAVEALLR